MRKMNVKNMWSIEYRFCNETLLDLKNEAKMKETLLQTCIMFDNYINSYRTSVKSATRGFEAPTSYYKSNFLPSKTRRLFDRLTYFIVSDINRLISFSFFPLDRKKSPYRSSRISRWSWLHRWYGCIGEHSSSDSRKNR